MKRPADAERTLERIQTWRTLCPEITLRSTFIVGFPGETEAEFEALLGFLEAAQLDRVGCFAYSPVDGAAANDLPDPVPHQVQEERRARFMQTQAAISARKLAQKVGRTLRVIVDHVDTKGATARSMADAPEIDGAVRIRNGAQLKPGTFVDVQIDRADAHDLSGLLVVDKKSTRKGA
jgi:ribosomal protein S12 methylthiotransferase